MPLSTPSKSRKSSSHGDRFSPTNRSLRHIPTRVINTLEQSPKCRRSTFSLFAIIAYLIVGQLIDPGFTKYWWYQLGQTAAILFVVLSVETLFSTDGGIAWQTHGIVVLTTYADVIGNANGLYHRFNPYDKFVHFWSGAAFAAGSYEVLRLLNLRGLISLPPRRRLLIALSISFAIAGVSWEIYEQLSDTLFNSGRVQSRGDTVIDLATDLLGGLSAVLILQHHEAYRTAAEDRSVDSPSSRALTTRGR